MYTACLTGYILDVYDLGHETQKIKFAPKQHKAWLNAKYLTFTLLFYLIILFWLVTKSKDETVCLKWPASENLQTQLWVQNPSIGKIL